MKEDSVIFIGLDTSKLKISVAVADGARNGEVRFFGDISSEPASVASMVNKLSKRGAKLYFCLYEESQCGTVVRVTFFALRRLLRHPRSEPNCMTRLVYPSQIQLIYGRRTGRLHQHPACGGRGLRRTKPFYETAFQAKQKFGSSTWIRQD
jgi:hypothetical protein